MAFKLPSLPYAFDALEPHIDARTMEVHHDKHHNAYVTKLNAAIAGTPAEELSIEEICSRISEFSAAVRNNGGGHYNHSLFWEVMSPDGGGNPEGALAEAIDEAFGSLDELKTTFNAAAAGQFGSGWAWLIKNAEGKLQITATPNQDNPLMDVAPVKGTPLLGLDVWEHAYYLTYQNRRPDYCAAWWNLVNWSEVASRFE